MEHISIANKAVQIQSSLGNDEQDRNNDDSSENFKVLNRQEAQTLLAQLSQKTLLSLLWVQALAGFCVMALASFWSGYAGVMSSVIAGVLCALLPSALFVWQMGVRNVCGGTPQVSLTKFFVWEAVKIICAIALLVVAVLWIRPLVWPALLAGFVVTVKAYGIGCWLSLGSNKQVKS